MKYGVLFFKDTENIGDDIQTYAAARHLPKIDYYIDRENLDSFVSDKKEKVSVIMSHWFLHTKTNFPPSPYINPLFISSHFTDNLEDKCPRYLKGFGAEYLKKYAPLGLRDNLVKEYLDEQGIKTYFSGCMTLTLKLDEKNIKKTNKICAVDIPEELLEKLTNSYGKNIKKITHKVNLEKNRKLSFEQRMNNVKKLLKEYQESKCVITTRLHCALPCLAIGTPVLLIYDEQDKDVRNRLGEYLKLLHSIKKSEVYTNYDQIEEFINENKQNSDDYLTYRKSLENKVNKFINKKEKTLKVTDEKYINDFLNPHLENLKLQVNEARKLEEKIKFQENEINRLTEIIKSRDVELDRYYKSKIYKYSNILRKIMFWKK